MFSSLIITCARTPSYLQETLHSYLSYWDIHPHVFCEPGTNTKFPGSNYAIFHMNQTKLGCVSNWLHAVSYMYENTDTPYLLTMEDDIQWTAEAAYFLRSFMLDGKIFERKLENIGFISPYCSQANCYSQFYGMWQKARIQSTWCGALCMLFHRSSIKHLLDNRETFLKLAETNAKTPTHLDHAIGLLLRNRGVFTHNPTLIYHRGRVSTLIENNDKRACEHISRLPAL